MTAIYGTCAMQMPSSYSVVSADEMTYIDGGVGIPNAAVAFGINCGVQAIGAYFLGGGGGIALAKAAIKAVGQKAFTNTLKTVLAKFVAIKLANSIAGTVTGFILGSGGWSIGSMAANWWDARDRYKNNGWCDI